MTEMNLEPEPTGDITPEKPDGYWGSVSEPDSTTEATTTDAPTDSPT